MAMLINEAADRNAAGAANSPPIDEIDSSLAVLENALGALARRAEMVADAAERRGARTDALLAELDTVMARLVDA